MVKVLLKDYNTIPEHRKSQLPQTLTKVSEIKENNLKPERNVLEKSKNSPGFPKNLTPKQVLRVVLVDGVVSGGVTNEAEWTEFGEVGIREANRFGISFYLSKRVTDPIVGGGYWAAAGRMLKISWGLKTACYLFWWQYWNCIAVIVVLPQALLFSMFWMVQSRSYCGNGQNFSLTYKLQLSNNCR